MSCLSFYRKSVLKTGPLENLFGSRTIQALFERAIGVDVLFTHQTLICVTDCIQSTTTSFDRTTGEQHAERHAQRDDQKKEKGENECFHALDLGLKLLKSRARNRFKGQICFACVTIDEKHRDILLFCNFETLFAA